MGFSKEKEGTLKRGGFPREWTTNDLKDYCADFGREWSKHFECVKQEFYPLGHFCPDFIEWARVNGLIFKREDAWNMWAYPKNDSWWVPFMTYHAAMEEVDSRRRYAEKLGHLEKIGRAKCEKKRGGDRCLMCYPKTAKEITKEWEQKTGKKAWWGKKKKTAPKKVVPVLVEIPEDSMKDEVVDPRVNEVVRANVAASMAAGDDEIKIEDIPF